MNTQRTSAFLMANLGSEVTRLISARERNNQAQIGACYKRSLTILKEIFSMPDMHTRVAEINILSDLIHDLANANPMLHVSRKNIVSYFTPFSIRVVNSQNRGALVR